MNIYSISSILTFTTCFFLGLFILIKSRNITQNRLFSLATIITGIWCLFPFLSSVAIDKQKALFYTRIIYIYAAFVPAVWLHFMLTLLNKAQAKQGLIRVIYLISLLWSSLSFHPLYIEGTIRFAPFFSLIPGPLYIFFVLFFAVTMIIILMNLVQSYRQILGYRKNQLKYIIAASIISILAGVIHLSAAYFFMEPFPHDLLINIFPFIIAYAIAKHRLMDITVAITRAAIYILLYAFAFSAPIIIAVFANLLLRNLLNQNWWLVPAGVFIILISVVPYIANYARIRAEERILREQRRYQQNLQNASRGMTLVKDLNKLINFIVHIITRTVRLDYAGIYLLDKELKQYVLKGHRGKNAPKVTAFAIGAEGSIASLLVKDKVPIVYEEVKRVIQDQPEYSFYKSVEASMRDMGASVIVPSFIGDDLLGFLILGDKLSGQIYTQDDLNVFSVLANQSALAFENAQFYEDLKTTQAQLFHQSKLASLGEMASGMSHQINNRFNILSVASSAAALNLKKLEGCVSVNEDAQRSLEQIRYALERIKVNSLEGGEVVKSLLSFSRPAKEVREPLAINEVLDNSIKLLEHQISLDEIKIAREYANGLPDIFDNKNHLQEVFFNLIHNAYKVMRDKGVGTLTVKSELNEKEGFVKVSIKDTGRGIPKEDIPHLFTPFFTSKNQTLTGKEGYGLGLFVCQKIIMAQGGHISVESELGVGTAFMVFLPYRKEERKES